MNGESGRPTSPRDWEQRYIEGELPWDSGEPDAYLPRVVQDQGVERGKALEVGCGTGTNAISHRLHRWSSA